MSSLYLVSPTQQDMQLLWLQNLAQRLSQLGFGDGAERLLELREELTSPDVQGTQLPCFQVLVERLSQLGSEDAAERLMEHQLFQALLLAELEAEKTGAPGVFEKVPPDTLQAIRKYGPPLTPLSSHVCGDEGQVARFVAL